MKKGYKIQLKGIKFMLFLIREKVVKMVDKRIHKVYNTLCKGEERNDRND